jgi:hypothetical protein
MGKERLVEENVETTLFYKFQSGPSFEKSSV